LNCSQAQAILAIYRELKSDPVSTKALHEHLAGCDACRQVQTQQSFVGERIRSLPAIEPSPDAHSRLLRALATEHLNHLQHNPSTSPPPPAFLAPYLQSAQHGVQSDPLIAFSTADTGPLSIIQAPRKRRPSRQMSHAAILGIAATFLMVLLMGGLTSLLLLANRGIPNPPSSASVATFSQVAMAKYTTATAYTHVMSAAATRHAIYYTAYGDGQTGWMLQRLDAQTRKSVPLLTAASATPLIILGSSESWLTWLQMDAPSPSTNKHPAGNARAWTLRVLSLNPEQASIAVPITIAKDTFDQGTVPGWVHTPIQGIWFTNDGLLAAIIDNKGNAHLINYKLTANNIADAQQLASSSNGHILTSPTATGDGTSIYWSEEWQGNDGVLRSNIWTQQTQTTPPPHQGRWLPHPIISNYLFRSDGMSFHPNVVGDMLFLLSTNPAESANADQAAASAASTVTPTTTPVPSIQSNPATIDRVAFSFYPPQIDEAIQGMLLTFTVDGIAALPGPQNTNGPVSALQSGSRFLLWQSATRGFEMYDVVAKSPVSIGAGAIPPDASFVMVNDDTAVWAGSSASTPPGSTTTTLSMFSWPIAREPAGA